MSETWTEYGVMDDSGEVCRWILPNAEAIARTYGGTLVGRQVTASDWLPVDTDGAK